jgi:hypothetical protein
MRPAQATDLSGLILTASVLGQVAGVAGLVGLYLSLAPHGSASALASTTSVLAGVLVAVAVGAAVALPAMQVIRGQDRRDANGGARRHVAVQVLDPRRDADDADAARRGYLKPSKSLAASVSGRGAVGAVKDRIRTLAVVKDDAQGAGRRHVRKVAGGPVAGVDGPSGEADPVHGRPPSQPATPVRPVRERDVGAGGAKSGKAVPDTDAQLASLAPLDGRATGGR